MRTEELTKALEPAHNVQLALIDFSAVTFLDSTALRCLIAARKEMLKHGTAILRFSNVSSNIKRTLRVTGLERIFEIV
ncbi:MAG: STAS domain-containing protein [Candidatus Eremiobacteraeota bacterium]|nr:STAS domain-containing protein [Candidatus Eremiobacteraeota bacterium]